MRLGVDDAPTMAKDLGSKNESRLRPSLGIECLPRSSALSKIDRCRYCFQGSGSLRLRQSFGQERDISARFHTIPLRAMASLRS